MYLSFLDSELEINDMFCSYLSAPISPTFIVHFIKPFVFVYPSTLKSCDSQCQCKVKKKPKTDGVLFSEVDITKVKVKVPQYKTSSVICEELVNKWRQN